MLRVHHFFFKWRGLFKSNSLLSISVPHVFEFCSTNVFLWPISPELKHSAFSSKASNLFTLLKLTDPRNIPPEVEDWILLLMSFSRIYTTFYITLLRKKCEIISGITQHWLNNFYEFILISVPCEKKSLNFTMYRE